MVDPRTLPATLRQTATDLRRYDRHPEYFAFNMANLVQLLREAAGALEVRTPGPNGQEWET